MSKKEEPSKPDLGIYYEFLRGIVPKEPSLSFLAKDWQDADGWRSHARAKLMDLMDFSPGDVPLNSSLDSKKSRDGLVVEEISYGLPYGPRTRGYFLYPEKRKERLPAIVALHDHGGFFYYGKEKVVDTGQNNEVLREHKDLIYGGKSWASEAAKRGFAVLAVDGFLWGSRRIPIESVNEEFSGHFGGLDSDSNDYIRAFNLFWDTFESSLTSATILNAGTTWPGIQSYEDRRSLDYLLTREEVDPERVACGGLSGGGERTVFLAGLDSRIKAAFCIGFMSTIGSMLRNHIHGHGLIFYIPRITRFLDLPDIIALHAPSPLLVQFDKDDGLFSIDGQLEADQKISKIYEKMGRPESYVGRFYPGLHKFDREMQKDAFDWLEKVL